MDSLTITLFIGLGFGCVYTIFLLIWCLHNSIDSYWKRRSNQDTKSNLGNSYIGTSAIELESQSMLDRLDGTAKNISKNGKKYSFSSNSNSSASGYETSVSLSVERTLPPLPISQIKTNSTLTTSTDIEKSRSRFRVTELESQLLQQQPVKPGPREVNQESQQQQQQRRSRSPILNNFELLRHLNELLTGNNYISKPRSRSRYTDNGIEDIDCEEYEVFSRFKPQNHSRQGQVYPPISDQTIVQINNQGQINNHEDETDAISRNQDIRNYYEVVGSITPPVPVTRSFKPKVTQLIVKADVNNQSQFQQQNQNYQPKPKPRCNDFTTLTTIQTTATTSSSPSSSSPAPVSPIEVRNLSLALNCDEKDGGDNDYSALIIGTATLKYRIAGYCINIVKGTCSFYSYDIDQIPLQKLQLFNELGDRGNCENIAVKNLTFALLMWQKKIETYNRFRLFSDAKTKDFNTKDQVQRDYFGDVNYRYVDCLSVYLNHLNVCENQTNICLISDDFVSKTCSRKQTQPQDEEELQFQLDLEDDYKKFVHPVYYLLNDDFVSFLQSMRRSFGIALDKFHGTHNIYGDASSVHPVYPALSENSNKPKSLLTTRFISNIHKVQTTVQSWGNQSCSCLSSLLAD